MCIPLCKLQVVFHLRFRASGFYCILFKPAGLTRKKRHYESWLVFLTKRRSHAPLKPVFHPTTQAKFLFNYERGKFILCNPPHFTHEYEL